MLVTPQGVALRASRARSRRRPATKRTGRLELRFLRASPATSRKRAVAGLAPSLAARPESVSGASSRLRPPPVPLQLPAQPSVACPAVSSDVVTAPGGQLGRLYWALSSTFITEPAQPTRPLLIPCCAAPLGGRLGCSGASWFAAALGRETRGELLLCSSLLCSSLLCSSLLCSGLSNLQDQGGLVCLPIPECLQNGIK